MSNNSVDAILQRMITDAKNLNPDLDVSQGSETYLRFSATASTIWGTYKHLGWTLDQIFPTSMAQESLEVYAGNRGIAVDAMTSAELLTFIISRLRKPPAGGKARDFERWALEASSSGVAVPLSAPMLTSSTLSFDPSALVTPNSALVGLRLNESHVGTIVLTVDLASAQAVFGLGIGSFTSRTGVMEISSADELNGIWTVRGSVTAGYWWRMGEFDATSARYWRLRLASLSELSVYADPEWNNLTLYGLELYTSSTILERATSAKALMNHYGVGTLLTLLQPSTLSMRLCEAVRAKQELEGPVAPKDLRVQVPLESTLDLRIVITGRLASTLTYRTSVAQYFAALEPGGLLVSAQMVVFALEQGATNAVPWIRKSGGEWEEYPQMMIAGNTEKFILGTLELT